MGGSSRITWPYGHGEGRVDFIILISWRGGGGGGGGELGQFGGKKLSCLGGKLPLRSPSPLDETQLVIGTSLEKEVGMYHVRIQCVF